MAILQDPHITNGNARNEIGVELDGEVLRVWAYDGPADLNAKLERAREYVQGWCDGRNAGLHDSVVAARNNKA